MPRPRPLSDKRPPNHEFEIRTNRPIVLHACSFDVTERLIVKVHYTASIQFFWWGQISNRLHVVYTPLSLQHCRKFQVDRRCLWNISLISIGKTTVDARFRLQAVGEARCNTHHLSPVGVCANRGERGGYRPASCCGLCVIVNRPQVEGEARYESVGALRYERERPTRAFLRRLQTPFCKNSNSHQRRRERNPGCHQRDSCYDLRAII